MIWNIFWLWPVTRVTTTFVCILFMPAHTIWVPWPILPICSSTVLVLRYTHNNHKVRSHQMQCITSHYSAAWCLVCCKSMLMYAAWCGENDAMCRTAMHRIRCEWTFNANPNLYPNSTKPNCNRNIAKFTSIRQIAHHVHNPTITMTSLAAVIGCHVAQQHYRYTTGLPVVNTLSSFTHFLLFTSSMRYAENYYARQLRSTVCLNLALGQYLHYTNDHWHYKHRKSLSVTYLCAVMTNDIELCILPAVICFININYSDFISLQYHPFLNTAKRWS